MLPLLTKLFNIILDKACVPGVKALFYQFTRRKATLMILTIIEESLYSVVLENFLLVF